MKISLNINKKSTFNEIYLPILEAQERFILLYGGAGSGKSKFKAQELLIKHLQEKRKKTLIVRKVGKTLRHSVFAEMVTVINEWLGQNAGKIFNINKSDMEITCINGNKMIFTGLDDVEKLKSISGITDIWIEEATEIVEEDLTQLNLRLRGISKVPKQITLTFNPISALHWIKKRFFDAEQGNVRIVKTTYLDNKFLDEAYKQEIENLKTIDPVFYEIYALGNWGVLGNLVYTNYIVRDFDIKPLLPYQRNGIDWGFNDPTAAVKVALYDNELWVLNEFYRKGLTNTDLLKEVKPIFDFNNKIIGDSVEPARILEFQRAGYKMKGAKKGQDSVKHGIDFIRRYKINIHPSCQNFINEIQAYHYRKDKDGNILEEPADINNHLMDALRYALEDDANERKLNWA